VLLPVQRDRLADDGRVATELPLPEPVAQDRHLVLARHVLLGHEPPAELRRDAQRAEDALRRARRLQPLRITARAGERGAPAREDEHALEELRLLAELAEPGG
jgi:hypothetical protein